MKGQISFRQYRAIDMTLFCALLCLCESLIVFGATRWFPAEPYTLSLTPAITAVVMVRWGGFAVIPALLGGLAFCLASAAAPQQFAIYCIGNLLAFLLLPLVRKDGWQRLHDQVLLALLYGLLTALLMQLGRGVIALILGADPNACAAFITTDALSGVFAALIVWITRRLDGVLEEQRHYLTRVAEETEREKQARQDEPWLGQY